MRGRSSKRDREKIRSVLGFRRVTVDDSERLVNWLRREVFPVDHKSEHLQQAVLDWCRRNRIEPPTASRTERILGSALKAYERDFFTASCDKIPKTCRDGLDALLLVPEANNDTGREISPFSELRADPGRVSLESVLKEVAKLKQIAAFGLPDDLFASVPSKILQKYRVRAAGERPSQLRRHAKSTRYTLVAAFCWQRRKEIIDGLVDLLIQVIHRIGARSEKKVVKTLLEDLRRVHGKTALLFRIAEAAVDNPEGIIKEVVYPVVGEQTLRDLVREFKATGAAYQKEVHSTMRASCGSHYRRMLAPLLDTLKFGSNNTMHRPVIDALEFLKAHQEGKQRYFSLEEGVPIDGVVQSNFREIVLEKDKNGIERINRINYEICVLQALRKRLRCKEIWVVGADRYRNPDDDLPSDFEMKREEYYAALKQPQEAEEFVTALKRSMAESLKRLNSTFPRNHKVKIIQGSKPRISIAKIDPQPDPPNLSQLKAEVTRRWPMTSLLDVLKGPTSESVSPKNSTTLLPGRSSTEMWCKSVCS